MPDPYAHFSPTGSTSAARPSGVSFFLSALNLLRPRQWTKNLLLFAGLVFSENLFCLPLLWRSLLAFTVFCLLSGSVYIFNDLCDLEEDRVHPRKSLRPLASGRIKIWQALAMALTLAAVSLSLAFNLGTSFLLISLLYFSLVLSYSVYFKHIVILDVFFIAAGFLLRAVAGGLVIEVSISPWLLICTLLLSLFLALNKRRSEILALDENRGNHRKVLMHYSVRYLDQLITIVTAAVIMAYSLYTFNKVERLMLSIPFVIYGIFRYLYLVQHQDMGESPEEVLLKDKAMLLNIFLWVAVCVLILYFDRGRL